MVWLAAAIIIALQLPAGIIAGRWIKRLAIEHFDRIEAEP